MTGNHTVAAVTRGKRMGYKLGREHGIRLGRCQSVIDSIRPVIPPIRDAKVLFIVQGFDAIDGGIIHGLKQIVRETHVGVASDMLRLAEEFRPDVVLVMNGLHVFPGDHPAHIDQIRDMGIRTAIWFADDPYFTDMTAPLAPHYDDVFTHELSCVGFYRHLGCQRVHYLPLAVNTSVFKPMHVGYEYHSDVCFIGNGFPNRIELFDKIAPFLADKKVVIAGALWDQMKNYSLLQHGIKLHWIPIEESVKYYNGAKVVLNVHRLTFDETYNKNSRNIPGHSINPRTFEIAACGALQMTDYRHDLKQYFKPGQDIETFDHADELVLKLEHYLAHEEDRLKIAAHGLRRSVLEHTFVNRLSRLLNLVFS